MKTKIYLAKSNRSNPDDVSAVRRLLSEYDDIEVVEFKGGGYSHKDLLGCEMLLIVPDLSKLVEDDSIPLGKGLHEQIEAFTNRKPNECDTLIVYEVGEGGILVTPVDGLDVADTNDYINYSYALIDTSNGDSLKLIIETRFGFVASDKTVNTSISNSDYMYLLIGK